MEDENLDPFVKEVKILMRRDFGRRLWESMHDITLAGMALHPT